VAYELSERLVVGVASSALFDLTESDAYFKQHGELVYRQYQDEHIADPLRKGVAFPFIQRLLQLNDLRPGDPLVQVIVLSRNDADTGLRVMRSIAHHKMDMTRAIFTQGVAPYEYIEALEMSFFLSGNRPDVDAATRAGFPGGHVLPSQAEYDEADRPLRVAFDFDGVLAGDSSERVYRSDGIDEYMRHESSHREDPIEPGLLKPLLEDLNRTQQLEESKRLEEPGYVPRLRIALVTTRSASAHERAVHSLRRWGVWVNDAFFLGGIAKARVLKVLRPHVFFDDQDVHLTGSAEHIAGVHIPYGVANEKAQDA
jgi:5'-nucleotidase